MNVWPCKAGPLRWASFGPLLDRWLIDMQGTGRPAQLQDTRSEGEAQEKPTKEPLPPFPVFRDFNSLNPPALLLSFLKRLLSPLTHTQPVSGVSRSLARPSRECGGGAGSLRKCQDLVPLGLGAVPLSADLTLFFSSSCFCLSLS